MNGLVDEFGRALHGLKIRSADSEDPVEINVWVDTAFNGELVVPRAMIESLGLEQSAGIRARLADGNEVTMERGNPHLGFVRELGLFDRSRAAGRPTASGHTLLSRGATSEGILLDNCRAVINLMTPLQVSAPAGDSSKI